YVRRVVVNLARSQWRRNAIQRKYAGRIETDHVMRQRAAETDPVDSELHDALWAALQQLPTRQREVVVCRFYLDMSEAETADALGVSLGTVKASSSRGLAAMRAALAQEVEQ